MYFIYKLYFSYVKTYKFHLYIFDINLYYLVTDYDTIKKVAH